LWKNNPNWGMGMIMTDNGSTIAIDLEAAL